LASHGVQGLRKSEVGLELLNLLLRLLKSLHLLINAILGPFLELLEFLSNKGGQKLSHLWVQHGRFLEEFQY
jgi:hypothetical protein